MSIGRYYLRRGQYVAAINRFRNVVERYQTTTHVPEALHRLTECLSRARRCSRRRRRTQRCSATTFPGSQWYLDSYALVERWSQPVSRSGRTPRCGPAGAPDRGGAMLISLAIRDIILIERLDLEFERGLCALTGETGAGKSILLDALGLALGGRAERALVRAGAAQGSVSAAFAVPAGDGNLSALLDGPRPRRSRTAWCSDAWSAPTGARARSSTISR